MKKFILKTAKVVSLIFFFTFYSNINAQDYFHIVINNNTTCDYSVEVFGGSPLVSLGLFNAPQGVTTSYNIICYSGRPLALALFDDFNGLGCSYAIAPMQTIPFGCSSCSFCCFASNTATTSIGSVTPPGTCGMFGTLYTQTVNLF